jgi:serine/threonine protein kinase
MNRPFPDAVAKKILLDVSEGLHFLHLMGRVHRDVKMENIFLRRSAANQFDAYLGDFGLSTIAGRNQEVAGTIPFMSRAGQAGIASMIGDYESLLFVGIVLWSGWLPWIDLESDRTVLRRKAAAFADLDSFFARMNAGPTPEYLRLLGQLIVRAGVLDRPDMANVRVAFQGHGFTDPINFDELIQVK